ncbi:hypothetical protein [Roseovarius sp. MMSF_3281]|uniref:hypothetical protein n=1 Tax=Roseovarius sp. MMSF_3281 TaxID=3046694 RepID=UPI00273EC02E|nr:hypothetical protein [Roseovarius sp. MMSF_3281]
MDVILHVGAHRTATTCFQNYLRENREELWARGIESWEPRLTRAGLFRGVVPIPGRGEPQAQLDRARGRIAIQIEKAAARGSRFLVVSDDNMLGTPRINLRDARLYADAGQRMARFAHAFGAVAPRMALSIRQQDMFWASSMAFGVARGHRLLRARDLQHITRGPRGWREVIEDLACAMDGAAPIMVMPYEVFGGRSEARLGAMTGQGDLPRSHAREWMNKSPRLAQLRQVLRDRGIDPARLPDGEGRWMPFTNDQIATLQEAYQDDLFWLTRGADGLAQLTEETGPVTAGQTPRPGEMTRGHANGIEERRMA